MNAANGLQSMEGSMGKVTNENITGRNQMQLQENSGRSADMREHERMQTMS